MTTDSNYALYRHQIKKMNPKMDEKEIYRNWFNLTYGNWNIQQTPVCGYDGMYHYLYVSVRDDGKIYVGKHSTNDLDDGYQGSGSAISKSIKDKHSFNTTILEYFRNGSSAYDAENRVVNNRYLIESNDIVLNKAVGGKIPSSASLYNKSSIVGSDVDKKMRNISRTANKPKYYTFTMLGCKVNDSLTFFDDDTIKCKVKDDKSVTYDGKTYSLYSLTKKVSSITIKNPLDVWKFKGKTLAKIRDEKYNN